MHGIRKRNFVLGFKISANALLTTDLKGERQSIQMNQMFLHSMQDFVYSLFLVAVKINHFDNISFFVHCYRDFDLVFHRSSGGDLVPLTCDWDLEGALSEEPRIDLTLQIKPKEPGK